MVVQLNCFSDEQTNTPPIWTEIVTDIRKEVISALGWSHCAFPKGPGVLVVQLHTAEAKTGIYRKAGQRIFPFQLLQELEMGARFAKTNKQHYLSCWLEVCTSPVQHMAFLASSSREQHDPSTQQRSLTMLRCVPQLPNNKSGVEFKTSPHPRAVGVLEC